ncbi:hypothetical protein PMIN02_005829 [Paraphaeosphaeria minitans]
MSAASLDSMLACRSNIDEDLERAIDLLHSVMCEMCEKFARSAQGKVRNCERRAVEVAMAVPAPLVAQFLWLVPPTSEFRFGPRSKFTTTPPSTTADFSP